MTPLTNSPTHPKSKLTRLTIIQCLTRFASVITPNAGHPIMEKLPCYITQQTGILMEIVNIYQIARLAVGIRRMTC